jgi:predicted XRE-type DNA-binding protein
LWEELGLAEDIQEMAIREVLAHELAQAIKRRKWSKVELAKRLNTSRPQLDRLLDPHSEGGITIGTLSKAARVIGKRIEIKLVAA